MHSSVNNHDTSTNILTLKEIVAIIVVFSFVLYLLFPKGDIESLIEENSQHTNLSINYLESMLLYYPDNVKLKMILVRNYDYAGKTDKALLLNQQIIDITSQKELLVQLYKTQYLLEKDNYFKTEDTALLTRLKERLLDYYEYTKGERNYLFLFGEATNIDYTYLKYHSLIGLMKQQPELIDYEFEKQAYYLASTLNYEEDAYARLISLLNYTEIDATLQNYALNSLIMHHEYKHATEIAYNLFLNSHDKGDVTRFFYLALYTLGKDPTREKGSIKRLIQDYVENKELYASDIYIILNTLLQEGYLKEASTHALSLFRKNPEAFEEKTMDLALKALTYDSKLSEARELVAYAEEKFHKQKYLDQYIQLSLWLSDIETMNHLYRKGYEEYADIKYENYLLKQEDMDNSYEILGKIYKDKVEQGEYSFVKNLSNYYHYTGELDEAENYFNSLLKKIENRDLHAAAVNFTLDNSHFEKAFKLYKKYQSNYALNPILHEKVIKRLIASKHFSKAYKLTKVLNEAKALKEKRLFTDLSWMKKDYDYLHKQLWGFEKQAQLNSTGYEHLILLETALNRGKKLSYLYQRAWHNTKNSYHLIALMYRELEEKSFSEFKTTLSELSPNEKKLLSGNINYQILLSNYYAQTSNISLAEKAFDRAFKIEPLKVSTHQSYLWFLIDNQEKNKQLKVKILTELQLLRQRPLLQKAVGISSVVAAMYVQKNELASRWSKQFIKSDPQNQEYKTLYKEVLTAQKTELYEIYDKMLNNEYLNGEISLKKRHLSATQDVDESKFSYQWKIYKNIKSKLNIKHYSYKTKGFKAEDETAFELILKNTQKKFLWEVSLAQHNAKEDYLSSRINLGYSFHKLQINVDAKYQNKTELTPTLERDAIENALALSLQNAISQRVSLGFVYQQSQYKKQNGLKLGEGEQIQLNANYILRSGYPDIAFNGYLSQNHFSQNIAQNFSELGVAMSVGTARQITLNKEWRPFGTLGFAINDQQNMGSSLSFGISRVLRGEDSLDLLLNYSDGIGVISEPIYGVNVKYRF